ncbi:MAG: aldehyde ferredoxin oxidoreductase family protein [Anaerolineales bacterium]|nr:aldehyde ferredoxin oxidoreductase family protein [Anaerolineales bacterium]
MPNGYAGRILHVDLTLRILTVEQPEPGFYRKYMGGSAMGLYYLLRDVPAGIDPLGPDNVLTFMLSPLTGAPISGQSRMTINARSPLTHGVGDSQAGGFFPAEMKAAGFDGLVIRGQASRPVYLYLHDGAYELRDAAHLWGKTTSEVDDLVKQELNDDKVEITQCGIAGERMARVAAIMNMANRAAGRTGLGAVMGSKKLKAIVVRGTNKKLELADGAALSVLARRGAGEIKDNADVNGLALYGTAGVVMPQNAMGTLPTRNYSEGTFEGAEPISGEVMAETVLKERDTCYACAVRCKRVVETEFMSQKVLPKYGGAEYETLATFGSYCGIDDLQAVSLANQICNEYGLDTIGTGATIAWAMECLQEGLLTEDEIGLPLRYGNAEAMVRMTEMIARREGFGAILGEGSERAARRLEKGEEYLITVKGAEAPAHMPQAKRSLALIYAVNAFGADHQSSEHDPMVESGATDQYMERLGLLGIKERLEDRSLGRGKVEFAYTTQKMYSFLDSGNLCQFVFGPAWNLYGPAETVEAVRAITGWTDFTLEEMQTIGDRRLAMLRVFNQREGLGRNDDRLPKKFFKALGGKGPTAGVALDEADIESAKDMYYELAGCDVDGRVTPERLAALDLAWLI